MALCRGRLAFRSARADKHPYRCGTSPMPADDQTARRFRVLIVDDEEPVRTFVQRVLQQRYETASAADAVEAMQRARTEGPFDLVVTDVNMPKMAGDELAAQLRREGPTPKLCFLSG